MTRPPNPAVPQTGYQHGWFQVAFKNEVKEGLNPIQIGTRRLALLRSAESLRIFDADCPHRGAHLALGGTVCDGAIICPFHGYSIATSQEKSARFRATEHETFSFADLVFVRLSDQRENGWRDLLSGLAHDYTFVPALHLSARADMEIVIENAFDRLHFGAVHGVKTGTFRVLRDGHGALRVLSDFFLQRGSSVPYEAITISPGLVLVMLGGESPYGALTGAADTGLGHVEIRLSFLFPKSAFGEKPDYAQYKDLLAYSKQGLQQDIQIWENLATSNAPSWTEEDGPIREFRLFCQEFL